MTQDERNMLAQLATKIAQTPAPPRDPEAEDFIRKNIGARPDALYLMTQTVLIQDMALQQSQHQIQELQQRLSQAPQGNPAPGGGSFLGQQSAPVYAQPVQQPSQPQPQYAPSPVGPPASGMSGFLRTAAMTAAGVAAGTVAIQGIESLFNHHEGFGGQGLFGGGGGISGYGGGETVIENNYYGENQGSQHQQFTDASDPSVDIGPQADDFQAQDTDYDTTDDSNFDDSSDNSV